MKTKAKTQYEVLSPDGFPIDMESNFTTFEQANKAIDNFVKRFEMQGYYSTIKDGQRYQMPLDEIKLNCKIITL